MVDTQRPKPPATPAAKPARAGATASASHPKAGRALIRLLALVSVAGDPIVAGAALRTADISAFWRWFARDVSPSLASELEAAATEKADLDAAAAAAAERLVQLSQQAVDKAAAAGRSERLVIQLGGDAEFAALPSVLMCLGHLKLLQQATEFGGAINLIGNVPGVAKALLGVEVPNPALRGFWFCAAVRSIADPLEFLAGAVAAAGRQDVETVREAGLGVCFDAFLIEAQRQSLILGNRSGLFADIDLACRATQRFHAIARGVRYCFDLPISERWAYALAQLTRRISESLDAPLSAVTSDVIAALRPPRQGEDQLDDAAVLQAFNALYLLAAARHGRETLALNTTVERVWGEVGVAMESLCERALDRFKIDPSDRLAARRLDAATRMAAIRFGAEFATTLTRGRQAAERRGPAPTASEIAQTAG